MGINSDIEWCDTTLNFWYGCHKVSDGCTYCYMYRDMPRYGRDPNVVKKSGTFHDSLKWAKSGKLKPGSRIFVCSWSDFFIEEADDWRNEAWDIIRRTPEFIYLILTKRPENIQGRLPVDFNIERYNHVWLGITAENQDCLDERWKYLRQIQASVVFISHEPALGPLILPPDFLERGKHAWLIAGGESGPKARPAHPEWIIQDRNQCKIARLPFFFKQWGEWRETLAGDAEVEPIWINMTYDGIVRPGGQMLETDDQPYCMSKIGKKKAGRILDGREWNEFPE